LDGERFVYIDIDGEISEEDLVAEVVRRLESIEGTGVRINEEITLQTVSADSESNVLPYNEAIERLVAALDFQLVSMALEINGERVAILRSQSEVDEVLSLLKAQHLQAEDYLVVEFVETINTSPVTVPITEVLSISQVLQHLGRNITIMEEYVVRDGDTMGAIAANHGISLSQIIDDNPDVVPDDLRINDVLQVQHNRPFLSIRTIEEVTRTEIITIDDQIRENPSAP